VRAFAHTFRVAAPNGGFGVWWFCPPIPALAGNACRWALALANGINLEIEMQKLKKSWRIYGDLLALCICLVNISLFINIALSREEWAYIFVAFLWQDNSRERLYHSCIFRYSWHYLAEHIQNLRTSI
jgi:hypothetical protein